MTRLNLLQDQKAILTAQKEVLENKRGDIYVREQQAISDTLLPFFSGFSPDAYIEVTRGSVYFKMDHPDYSYKKELFSLYLREDWSEDDNISFKGIDLSYYTTSTKGVDAWELKRLRMLGDLAEIVLKNHDTIIDAANAATLPFKAQYKEEYAEMSKIGKDIRGVEQLITYLEKEKIEMDLKGEGVNFTSGKGIQLKYNYTPRVLSMKLIDVSKSGKKATAVFTFGRGGNVNTEENVSVESIINQVYNLREDIVQELLPA